MISKILSVAMNGLSWLAWVFQWMVIWPAATLVLLLVLLFCLDGTTPGKELVGVLQQADSITDGQKWTWHKCPIATGVVRREPPEVPIRMIGENCLEVVTDADGYAAHIDSSLRSTLSGLWAVMALSFCGLSCLLRRRPYHHRYALIKTSDGSENIRCGNSYHPQIGKGVSAVFPVRKGSKENKGCDVDTSSLPTKRDKREQ